MAEIPDAHIKSVFFLCINKLDGGVIKREPAATGFFVKVPLKVGQQMQRVEYLVTARHCIYEARRDAIDDKLYVRFNLKSGTFVEVESNIDDWITHPSADVAAIMVRNTKRPEGLSSVDVDAGGLLIELFVGPPPKYELVTRIDELGEEPIRMAPTVGYDVYFPGLFTQHSGKERNLPIARFGHISRMPAAVKIRHAGTDSTIVAYLCEFHSMGGHSRSPVFFEHPVMRETEMVDENGNPTGVNRFDTARAFGFMGLVSGHYDLSATEAPSGDSLGDMQAKMNSGIAIVTPAEAVRQLLMEDEVLVKEREKMKKDAEDNEPTPTMDFAATEDELST